MSWDRPDTVHVSGYTVRHQAGDADYVESDRIREEQTNFRMTNVAGDTMYRVAVRAHNDAVDSPWSTDVEILRRLPPSVPTNVAVSIGETSIILSWEAPAVGVPDGYRVEYGEQGADEPATEELPAVQTSYTHTDNVEGLTYQYRVRSVNSAGHSVWAGPVEARWVIPPTPPSGLTGEIDDNDILVSWTRPGSNFIDGYRVQFREENSPRWHDTVVAADQTSYRHAGSTPGITHEYRGRAENAGGVSQWSEVATAVRYQTAAPPRAIIFTPLGTRMLVQWVSSETPGVTSHQLRYRIDGGPWNHEDLTAAHYFADWSTDQTLHEYQMRALKDDNAGDWSAIHRATVATPAAVPSLTLNREGASSVRLHWQEPASGPPARYVIQARWRSQTEYRTVATRAGHITTTRHDIGYDSEYTYRVLVQNHFRIKGPHQEGVTAHVVIPAAERQWGDVPSNLSASMLDPGTVKLTWAAPERAGRQVDSYRIYRKPVGDPRCLGDSYRHHVMVAQTGNANTAYIDHTAQPGVTYEYGVAAYRDGYPHPLSSISHRAYARTW